MRLIGITGGVGTGKSTVTNYLQTRYSLPILDADIYARAAVVVGSPILAAIKRRYSDEILQSDGTLDRPQLGTIIFNDLAERQWLESQIHPYVRSCFNREIGHLQPTATAVLAIPLLFEVKLTKLVTEIWVVSCDLPAQIQRVMTRDRIDELAAKQRIDSQMSLAEKIALADVNLDNSTTVEHLEKQIDRYLNR